MSSIVIGNEMYRVEKIAPDEIQVWVGHPEGGCFEVDEHETYEFLIVFRNAHDPECRMITYYDGQQVESMPYRDPDMIRRAHQAIKVTRGERAWLPNRAP